MTMDPTAAFLGARADAIEDRIKAFASEAGATYTLLPALATWQEARGGIAAGEFARGWRDAYSGGDTDVVLEACPMMLATATSRLDGDELTAYMEALEVIWAVEVEMVRLGVSAGEAEALALEQLDGGAVLLRAIEAEALLDVDGDNLEDLWRTS